jgi:hypothetical protein
MVMCWRGLEQRAVLLLQNSTKLWLNWYCAAHYRYVLVLHCVTSQLMLRKIIAAVIVLISSNSSSSSDSELINTTSSSNTANCSSDL